VSSTVTHLTRQLVLTHTYESLSTGVGILAIGLLLVLLVQKEVARGWVTQRSLRVLDIALVPLAVAFLVIVAVRFVHLVR
jgi:hypothetical protein